MLEEKDCVIRKFKKENDTISEKLKIMEVELKNYRLITFQLKEQLKEANNINIIDKNSIKILNNILSIFKEQQQKQQFRQQEQQQQEQQQQSQLKPVNTNKNKIWDFDKTLAENVQYKNILPSCCRTIYKKLLPFRQINKHNNKKEKKKEKNKQ